MQVWMSCRHYMFACGSFRQIKEKERASYMPCLLGPNCLPTLALKDWRKFLQIKSISSRSPEVIIT